MAAITTEQAFDMLPYVVAIYEKADVNNYRKKKQKEYKGKKVSAEDAGIDLVLYVMKNLPKVKNEVFEAISIAQKKNVEEIKKQSLGNTLKSLKEIFMDDELMGFFKEAM